MRFALAVLLLSTVLVDRPLLAQGGHVISGFVRDEARNAPLPTATVQLLSGGIQIRPAISSGPEGEFSFTGLPDGDFSIVAQKTGYDTATVSVSITRSTPQPVTILLRASAPTHPLTLYNPISAHELAVPQRARAAYDKGTVLLEDQNKPADSIPEFQHAIDAYPSYYEAYTKIGIASYKLGKFPEAEIALKKAIDLSSNKSFEPLYLLADLYNGQRKYADAESLARQAVALDESSWNGHFELARALVGMRKGDEAEATALRATQLKPDNAPAHLVLANAHMLAQHYSAALAEFDTYLTLEPDGPLSPAVRQQRDRLQDQLQAAPPPPVTNNPKP